MNSTEARARLVSLADTSTDPALSSDELDDLVADASRFDAAGNSPLNVAAADAWVASTTYAYGDVVTADPAAGRWWRCVTPGTSATTQPDWPDVEGIKPGITTVTDDDIVWEDAGTEWAGVYDLNAAAAEAWRLKAAKVAGRYDFQTDGQTFRRSQMLANCRQMERMFRRRVASGVT